MLIKRILDILGALLASTFLLVPSFVIIVLIKLDSEGPAIFKQERLGLCGKTFVIYKFRTMRMDAEEDGPKFATKNDGRCTKIGATLRKLRIDEWPQFWNILKGDMSIVGPRPERDCFYQQFAEKIPGFRDRLSVKPGLTGYAQVFGGLELLPHEKLQYDLEYIANANIVMDLRCILKTISVIMSLLRTEV